MPGYALHAGWQKGTVNTPLPVNGLTSNEAKNLPG